MIRFKSFPIIFSFCLLFSAFVSGQSDLGVKLIVKPSGGFNLTYKEPVSVVISNYGSVAVTKVPLAYKIGSGKIINDTADITLNPGDNYSFTFKTNADLSKYGSYFIKAFTSLSNDINHLNDTARLSLYNLKRNYCAQQSYYPQVENIGMVKIGSFVNGSAIPVYNNKDSCIHTYSDFTSSLPPIKLIPDSVYNLQVSQINFSNKFNSCFINAFIDYNNDGVFDFYTERVWGKLTLSSQTTVSGNFTVSGSALKGITRMRIVMAEGTDALVSLPCGGYNYGETEDYNVLISPSIKSDAGVVDIIQPSAKEAEDAVLPVKVKVHNFGNGVITSMNIAYRLNQGDPVNYSWSGSLKPYNDIIVSLPSAKIPAYINNICAYTEVANDTNSFNDQFCKTFYGNPKIDLGPVALLSPAQGDCYSSSHDISVRVKGFGSQPVDMSKNNLIVTVSVYGANPAMFTDTVKTGIINVNDSIDVLLPQKYDMSAGGDYFFDISTSVSGDGVPTNNVLPIQKINVYPINSAYPHTESFESFSTGSPGYFDNGWQSVSPDFYRWEVNNGPVHALGTGPDVDHTLGTRDGKYIYVNADSLGGPAYLISPCFDISALDKPYFTFWYHMAGKSINNLHIDIYDGSQWIENIFSLKGSQQPDVNSPWKQALIDLTPYKGVIKVRFVADRGNGSYGDIAIDDVSVFEPQKDDAGICAFIQPDPFYASVGASQNVSVSVRNYGVTNITSAQVAYYLDGLTPVIETWNGDLQPKDTYNYTFKTPFTVTAGNHTLCAYVSISSDGNRINDTLCVQFSGISSLSPYTENFESFDNKAGAYNDGWKVEYISDYKWAMGKGPLNSNITGPAFDHTTGTSDGKYMYTDSDNGTLNDITSLISPPIDLKDFSHAKLSFWYHFYGADIDSMYVDIFASGKWKTIKTIAGQVQTYQRAAWNRSIIDIAAYNGIVKLRFRGIRGSGPNAYMAVDDISVYNSPAVDVAVQDIVEPLMFGLTAGSTQKLSVVLENKGLSNVKLLNVGFIVGNNSPVMEKVTYTIYQNSSYTYDFNSSFIVPSGEFNVKCFVELLNDTIKSNDTINKKYMGITQFNLPYADDFEGKKYWYSDDIINHWEYGAPDTNFVRLLTFDGKKSQASWVTKKEGNYNGGVEYSLYSPKFNFKNIYNAVLSFWQFEKSMQYTDGGRIMYSTDANPDWVTLGYIGDPNGTNWYNYNVQGKHCWTNVNNSSWINSSYKLSQFNNSQSPVRFKISFFTNYPANDKHSGWVIDNFSITVPPQPVDAGIASIVNPSDYTAAGSDVVVKAIVKNYGLNTLSSIPLSYQVDNDNAVLDTLKATLKRDSSAIFTFKKKFSSKNAYNLCVSTNLTGDNNSLNNKSCFHSFKDIGLYWIEKPIAQAIIDTSVAVTVVLKNYGISEINSADVTYTIDGVPKAKETWTGSLMPDEMVKYTFKNKLPRLTGSFSLCAYTTMFDDANATNNKICKSITSTTGIEKITVDGITLYQNIPNPVIDNTTIIFNLSPTYYQRSTNNDQLTLDIYNIFGVRLYSFNKQAVSGDNAFNINLSNLPQGVYIYTLTYKDIRLTRNLLKL